MSNAQKPRVDFIGIGAPRCGTTWISRCLAEHPDICFSNPKETHFFDLPYNRQQGFSFYASFFLNGDACKIQGEFTPAYYLNPDIAKELKDHYPRVKLIVVLRNPVKRFVSDVEYNARRTGCEHNVEQLIEQGSSRFIRAGFYHKHLSEFLKPFARKQVMIIIYEELVKEPQKTISSLYAFLGVNADFTPNALSRHHNTSKQMGLRWPVLYRFVNYRKKLKKSKAGHILVRTLKALGFNRVIKWLFTINSDAKAGNKYVPTFTDEHKVALHHLYKSDMTALTRDFHVNIEEWCEQKT